MASTCPLLLNPGPTELDPIVRNAVSHDAESHFSQPFCDTFGETLSMLRQLFQCNDPTAQPFVISGSGTLGWDFVATNLIEEGESVLCLSTGFFSDLFYNCLTTYGADTTRLSAPMGRAVALQEVERELRRKRYKAVVATHVDTSTAVLTRLKPLSDLVKRVSPDTLLIVDGVASVVAEELHFDDLGLDVVLTGSQKALSCQPGLSILMVSSRAIHVSQTRKAKQVTWYASLNRWLPIMQKYEAKQMSYFATPPTQLIHALHTSLTSILDKGLDEVVRRHRVKSDQVKEALESLGLPQLASDPDEQAHGLTAVWLPHGVAAADVLGKVLRRGVVMSKGMQPGYENRYIRFGHMGYTAHGAEDHIERGIEAVFEAMAECLPERKVGSESRDSGYASAHL